MNIGAVIVAAGRSSRMGDFKPMLNIGSISIAQRIIATFHQADVTKIAMVTGYNALIGMTSQLPKVTVETSTPLIGKNTVQCIDSGVVHCNAAMIDGMVDRITKELGVQPNLILTGGNALYVKPYITHSYEYDENLLQKGLLHLAKIN